MFRQVRWSPLEISKSWRWEKREPFGNKGQGTPAVDGASRTMWIFEPHVAEQVFEELAKENGLTIYHDQWPGLSRPSRENPRKM